MEEAAAELLINSRGLFLPHSGDDMVVSGSYFFAASLGVPVIARRNPFLGWLSSLPSAKGIFFYQSRRDIEGFYKMGTDATSSEEILAFANAEFGKRKIELCWRMVFNSIDIKC
ncbi:hypothetical protein GCM10009090_14140 [[Pseudomonas] boreopolis]|uniref:Uncharacterized protein n=2 Tax=Xanthomonas boreopolis TaxID=86183 RepID=A0A919KHL4_9XANT|nr:hypothetical protein GCM10009090_14140 [[Pseudomonas] boreopolis]